MTDADLRTRIKEMMVKNLMLQMPADQIADDAPLFGPNGIGLDSIDALELAVGLEKNFGVSVGGAFARAAWGGFIRSAKELIETGTFEELKHGASYDELQRLFARP